MAGQTASSERGVPTTPRGLPPDEGSSTRQLTYSRVLLEDLLDIRDAVAPDGREKRRSRGRGLRGGQGGARLAQDLASLHVRLSMIG